MLSSRKWDKTVEYWHNESQKWDKRQRRQAGSGKPGIREAGIKGNA